VPLEGFRANSPTYSFLELYPQPALGGLTPKAFDTVAGGLRIATIFANFFLNLQGFTMQSLGIRFVVSKGETVAQP
jgi:hypothetical protein